MFDPVFLFFISKFCLWYGLGYTSSRSPLRPLLFIVIFITCLASLRSRMLHYIPGAAANDYIVGTIFHASNWFLIAHKVPPSNVSTARARALWALNAAVEGRWKISHIPPFSEKDRNYVPSRRKLFMTRLLEFACTFSLGWCLQHNSPLHWTDYQAPPGFLSRLNEVSRRELLVRMYLAMSGLFIPYLGLRAGHSFFTCIALIFGAEPKDWPPLFGSIKEGFTVRRWYS
jgi:hypothetical protein